MARELHRIGKGMRLRGVFISFLLGWLCLAPLQQAKAGGGGPGCVGWVCGAKEVGKWVGGYHWWSRLAAIGKPGFQAGMATLDWIRENVAWGYNEYANWALQGMGTLTPEEALALDLGKGLYTEIVSEGAASVGIMGIGKGIRTGVRGARGLYGALGNLRGAANFGYIDRAVVRGLQSGAYDIAGVSPEMKRIIFEQQRFLARTPAGTHLAVREGSVTLEFDAMESFLQNVTVNPGGNQTVETLAAVSPWGEIIVFEGRHRAVGAALGKVIGEGGVPGMPGRLRYNLSDIPVARRDWEYWRTDFAPIRELVRNQEIVEAALSGAR